MNCKRTLNEIIMLRGLVKSCVHYKEFNERIPLMSDSQSAG